MLNGVLLGLGAARVRIKSPSAPCCDGRGFTEDPRQSAQIRCHIKQGLKATEALIVRYLRTWSHCRKDASHKIHASQSAEASSSTGEFA